MSTLNQVTLIGNIGKDPETHSFNGGSSKTVFSVATDDGYMDKEGTWQSKINWHNVEAWGKLGEKCESSMKKGYKVVVIGSVQYRSWDDSDGKTRYATEIRADKVRIVSKPDSNSSSSSSGAMSRSTDFDDDPGF